MAEEDPGAEVDAEVSGMMKPSPSALMLAAGLATAQSTLRDRGSSAGAEGLHCGPSTELQAGYPLRPPSPQAAHALEASLPPACFCSHALHSSTVCLPRP